MAARTRSRGARRLAAVVIALAGAGSPAAAQQTPVPFPVVMPEPPAIEIYYGATKVAPLPPPPMAPVLPPVELIPVAASEAKGGPSIQDPPRPGEALVEAFHSVRDGSRRVSTATVGLLEKIGDRISQPAEVPTIILANYPVPPAPLPLTPAHLEPSTPVPAPVAPAQPTIVVVRDAAEPRPSPEPAPGLTFSYETMAALGVGLVGLLFGMMAWARGSRKPMHAAMPVVMPASHLPHDPNAVRLMGKYNAGPLPETAEKFDVGPTYHDEVKQKKDAVEANNAAAVEFILNQNLALLAALNPGATEEAAAQA